MNSGKALGHLGSQDGALSETFTGKSLMGEGYPVIKALKTHSMDAGELPDTHRSSVWVHAHILLNDSGE